MNMDKICEDHALSSKMNIKEQNHNTERKLILIEQADLYEKRIKTLHNLKELFVIEDRKLTNINLMSVQKLEKLILYSNGFTKIPDVTKCKFLQVLCLANNNISNIEGLEHLIFLKELNLSQNKISFINKGLQKNINLKKLYLSANPIKYFGNITNLCRAISIRKIYFSDPLYGECPVTKNQLHYRLQIIRMMPSLEELDGFPITLQDKEVNKHFMSDFLLEYENELASLESEFKTEKEIMLKSFSTQMEMFHLLQEKYKQDMIYNTSQILEAKLKFLSNEIKIWKSRFDDLLRELSHKRLLRRTQYILRKENFHNIEFIPLQDPDSCKVFHNVLQSFICSSFSEKNFVQNINVSNVSYITAQIYNDMIKKEDHQHYTYFLMKSPFKVLSLAEWRETLSSHFPFVHSLNLILTNCMISCDLECIENVKQDYMRNHRKESRIAILAGFKSEQIVLYQYKNVDGIQGHGDNTSCREFHANCDECVFYAVEFQYEFKDKYKLFRDMSLLKEDVKLPTSDKGKSIAHHLLFPQYCLTSVTLSACNISEVGNVKEVYDHVLELDISYNKLTDINELFLVFPNLLRIDVSHNNISQLKSTKVINSLKSLDLSWNKVSSFFEVSKFISIFMKNLKCLNIEFNPIEDVLCDEYQAAMIRESLVHFEKFNQINLSERKNYESLEINDTLIENEVSLNLTPKDLENQLFISNLGLANKLLNFKNPQHLITVRQDSRKGLEGFCVKSSTSVDNISIISPNLQWIFVTDNCVSHIRIGIQLSGLQEMYLSHNRIRKIDFDLNLLPNLTKLDISYNFLHSLISFRNAKLNRLIYLNISGNFILQLNDLAHLLSIEQLYLAWNSIKEDLAVLKKINTLTQLQSIDITGNSLNNIHNIKHFIAHNFPFIMHINGERIDSENKKYASEMFNAILDLAYLLRTYTWSQLTTLTHLTLSNVSLKIIELNKNTTPNLTSVNLERNDIEYISNLCDLPNLKILRLSYNKVRGLQEINVSLDDNVKIFGKLETIFLDHNGISMLQPFYLHRYQNLKHLFLHENKIEDLKELENAAMLKVLVLDKNEISKIPVTCFSKLKYLDQLYLESNKLEDLQFTQCINSPLRKLFLSYNRIKDLRTLFHLRCLKSLRELTLLGNNISWKEEYYPTVISTLHRVHYLDGHNIQYKEDQL